MINFSDIEKRNDDEVFCIEGKDVYTILNLKDDVASLVYYYMKNYNVTELSKVCFIAKNSYKLLVHLVALSHLKISTIGINYTFERCKINMLIEIAECDLVLTDNDEYRNGIVDVVNINNIALTNASHDILKISNKRNQMQVELFTSGTSGLPKLITKVNSNFARRKSNLDYVLKFQSGEQFKYLVTTPFFHASTKGWIKYFSTFNTTFVISSDLTTIELDELIIKYDVDSMLITPNKLRELSSEKLFKCIIVGGAHFPINVKIEAFKRFGEEIYEYYGTSETGVNSLTKIDPYNKSYIKPLPGVKYKIVDDKMAINSYELLNTYKGICVPFIVDGGDKYFVTNDNALSVGDEYYIKGRSDYTLDKDMDYNIIYDILCSINFIYDVKFEERNSVKIVYIASEYKYCRLIKEFVNELLGEEWKINISPYIIYSLTGKC